MSGMFAGLYGDLPPSKPAEEEELKPKKASGGPSLYGGLYGDAEDDAGSDAKAKEAGGGEEAAAAEAEAPAAAKPPAAAVVSAAPTVPKAEPEAAKPKAWGVPKFMPQQRKRAQPSPASRNAASALAAKKQKLLQQKQQEHQQKQQTVSEVAAIAPAPSKPAGGLYSYEVIDEYDPRRPHDYDRLFKLRKKQKEIDRKMRMLEDQERDEREEREKRQREAEARGEAAPQEAIVPIAAGRGRGRGVNIPAWMSKQGAGGEPGAGRGHGAPPPGVGASPAAAEEDGGDLGAGENVAEKMMAKMGYRAGAGLGRAEQGMTTSLQVQKTDRTSGSNTQTLPRVLRNALSWIVLGAGVITQAPAMGGTRNSPPSHDPRMHV